MRRPTSDESDPDGLAMKRRSLADCVINQRCGETGVTILNFWPFVNEEPVRRGHALMTPKGETAIGSTKLTKTSTRTGYLRGRSAAFRRFYGSCAA